MTEHHATARSLVEPLLDRVVHGADEPLFWFWNEDGSRETVTVGALNRAMCDRAHALHGLGLAPGDVVILVLGHSRHLIDLFWGALYAGVVPTIFPYRSPAQSVERHEDAVCKLAERCGARLVVSTATRAPDLRKRLAPTGCLVVSDDELAAAPSSSDAGTAARHRSDGDVAFIQHTSGTTGEKKGVMLSHRAALSCVRELGRHTDVQPEDVLVSWLPLSHDYGLVCGLLCPPILGVRGVLLSPHQWARRPSLLFEAISRHGGTMCWMPNFALNHCVRVVRPRDLEGIDLGSVRALMSGAEPVRHESQRAFAERFAAQGFKEESLCAGYGMAETTLAVTVTALGEPSRVDWVDSAMLHAEGKAIPVERTSPGAVSFVSGGKPLAGVQIRIVGRDGAVLGEREVGEVRVRTASMFSGYHRNPEATAAAIVDGWYLTGDVGYWAGGELFPCGRKSDTIIVAGANVYPIDVETIALRHPEIKENGVVAFGLDDGGSGTEVVILVAEERVRSGPDEREHLARRLRGEIVSELGIAPGDVRIVRRGWVVKTPNGKLSRSRSRERYLREFRRAPIR